MLKESKKLKNSQPFITLENVTLRVGDKWLLPGTHWRINRGENWVVRGPNGAGKTTLVKALLGQVAVVQGHIRRHYERDGYGERPAMALVSCEQYHKLYAQEQLLKEMRSFSGQVNEQTLGESVVASTVKDAQAPGDRWSDIMGALALAPLLAKPMEALSSGEMRRLLLGRALLADPLLLILDEPFNGLDAAARDVLIRLFDKLAAAGTQMILITHRLEEIPSHSTHVLCLDHGRVSWQGPRDDFFKCFSSGKNSTGGIQENLCSDSPSAARQHGPEENSCTGPLVRMSEVSVRFGEKVVIDGLDWTVRAGEHWAVCGPNGAGKSTLLKLITGDHLQAYANEIYLFGRRKGTGESVWDIKRHIGYVSDEFQARYQKQMTGFDVVCSGFFDSVGLYRRCTPRQRDLARQWIETLALHDLAGQPFKHLSFGQQRLILIARAVVKTPRLLILDEPCSGLDHDYRQRMLTLIDRIGTEGATTLIYVSHHVEDIPACITHRLELGLAGFKVPLSGQDGSYKTAAPS